ncbi:MAG: sulfurtransferase [Nitrospirae bacterium]|nr:sulfurtransferase [Nitrospirota bacterium]
MSKLRVRGNMLFSRSRSSVVGIFAFFFLLSLVFVSQIAFAEGVQPLVETKWLAENLKKPDVRILYVGSMAPDDMAKFGSKHIPGSMYMSSNSLMKVLGNGSTPPNKNEFEALMGRLGISNDTHVVVYGEGGGNPFITNAFWLLDYFGHKKVSYLNGGISKWAQEKLQIETGPPAEIKTTKYKATPDSSIFSDADYVLKNLKNPKVAIVDTRGADAFSGKVNEVETNKRVGHIPGAADLMFFTTNLKGDGTFKSVEDLKGVYESKGVTKDKEVIVYCQGGVRAAHTYFVLKHILGYPKVRNYVGSWGEWSNLEPAKYPVEK